MSDSLLKKLEELETLATKARSGLYTPMAQQQLMDCHYAFREAVPALCAALREAIDAFERIGWHDLSAKECAHIARAFLEKFSANASNDGEGK